VPLREAFTARWGSQPTSRLETAAPSTTVTRQQAAARHQCRRGIAYNPQLATKLMLRNPGNVNTATMMPSIAAVRSSESFQ
jgi:hypothetical protein